jgi:hypothetical protein
MSMGLYFFIAFGPSDLRGGTLKRLATNLRILSAANSLLQCGGTAAAGGISEISTRNSDYYADSCLDLKPSSMPLPPINSRGDSLCFLELSMDSRRPMPGPTPFDRLIELVRQIHV